MSGSGINTSPGGAALSSDVPPLGQCLSLEPITLPNQKYTRSGELRRVLGVPTGSKPDEHSFGVGNFKPPPPVATEELKQFKDSLQDSSRNARDRVKNLRESVYKVDKYKEGLNTKKRRRNDILPGERSVGVNLVKMGNQIQRNQQDTMSQKPEERAKSVGLNKRVRTSLVNTESRAAATRNQMEKDADCLPGVNASSVSIEEKIRKMPPAGDIWETKLKRKRSVATVGNRVINDDRDVKRAMQLKVTTDSKLRSPDVGIFSPKPSPGFSRTNKLGGTFESSNSDSSLVLKNVLDSITLPRDQTTPLEQRFMAKGYNKSNFDAKNAANNSNTMAKGKFSRTTRTGSMMELDSSSRGEPLSGGFQGWEQPAGVDSVPALGIENNQKVPVSAAGSFSIATAQWVGQRPYKNSRTRRTNLVSPVSDNIENQISSQGFPSDFNARISLGNGGSPLGGPRNIPRLDRESDDFSSPFGVSESEESGAGDNKSKDKGIDDGEMTPGHKLGPLMLPVRKIKGSTNEGGGVRKQGRIGNGLYLPRPDFHPIKEKSDTLPTTKPLQSTRAAYGKVKSKSGRPPSRKVKERKASTCNLNSVSLDFTGESYDDHEELFAAANSARKASYLACSGPFWKQMESIFASVSTEDLSYLQQQLSSAEELDESLFQMFHILGVAEKKVPACSHADQMNHYSQESPTADILSEKMVVGKSDKASPLYQRILSALIVEDESEDMLQNNDGKNIPLHYASDDSHCGSCNYFDIEPRDRDRMESEVESNVEFHNQRTCLMDRLSGNKSVVTNSFRNSCMSNSAHSNDRWLGDDDCMHSDTVLVSEICSYDTGPQQPRELSVPSDCQYQLMSLDERVLLELHSIGIYPETSPDSAEIEAINQDIMELQEGLHRQIREKKKKMIELDKAIQEGKVVDRSNLACVAMDQLVELAYRKRLACRGGNASKVRKMSRQVALAFIKKTLDRCRKYEETGTNVFSETALLQDALFSAPPCSNEAKSADNIGSGTASNTCNEASNNQTEAKGSGAVSSSKRREVPIDDFIGSASSRVTTTVLNGAIGKISDRDMEQRIKPKPKQKTNQFPKQPSNLPTYGSTIAGASNSNGTIKAKSSALTQQPAGESGAFESLQLPDFASVGELDVSNDPPPDMSNWLNFEEDGLLDCEGTGGLEIPMDDLSDLLF